MGFATKGAGQDAPDSFGGAMKDTESTAWVMWRCTSGKEQCDFSQTGDELLDELRAPLDIDACNKYPDCHSCISAKEGDVKCGWCQGGTLNYHDQMSKWLKWSNKSEIFRIWLEEMLKR